MTDFITLLSTEFQKNANPEVAEGQKAYLRNQFDAYGIKTPIRRELWVAHSTAVSTRIMRVARKSGAKGRESCVVFGLPICWRTQSAPGAESR